MFSWLFHNEDAPTQKQLNYAKKLGVPIDSSMNKEDVSIAIDKFISRRPKLKRQRQHIAESYRRKEEQTKGFFASLFSAPASRGGRDCMTGYWCDASIRLDDPIETPLGRKVRIVTPCVDIWFEVDDEDEITITNVRHARGGSLLGNCTINVAASRSGEAWYERDLFDSRDLIEAVEKDLYKRGSQLKQMLLSKFRCG